MLLKINKCKIFWDFGIQAEQPVLEKQANLVGVKKEKTTSQIVDASAPANHKLMTKKESGKIQ